MAKWSSVVCPFCRARMVARNPPEVKALLLLCKSCGFEEEHASAAALSQPPANDARKTIAPEIADEDEAPRSHRKRKRSPTQP